MENRRQNLKENEKMSDICLILEGTYPYVRGGVSSWAHNLIQANQDLSFDLVCLVPMDSDLKIKYDIPNNVVGKTDVVLQQLPKGSNLKKGKIKPLIRAMEENILKLQTEGTLESLKNIIEAIGKINKGIGSKVLLDSEEAWEMLINTYTEFTPKSSFLNFFWSWRSFVGGLYSIILSKLPPSRVYHALCTGYAGVYLAKASIEAKKPCILTEHGIYTNERRMEITIASWLYDAISMDLNIDSELEEKGLKDYWINAFRKFSQVTYEAASSIITLYEGNKELQIVDGANEDKIRIIPNGIDVDKYKNIQKSKNRPPTIAMIGRVVPIKDVKTCIRTTALIKKTIKDIRSLIMGPFDEDPHYYQECIELVEQYELKEHLSFTGNIDVKEYFKEVDVIILASISEAQPLVILEAGAAGIPCVSTDVGSCRDLILGRNDEDPPLGKGGGIAYLYDPETIADQVIELLSDTALYEKCSHTIQQRIEKYYHIKDQNLAYRELYTNLMSR